MEINILYDIEKLKKELIEMDKQIYSRRLTSDGGGGSSMRVPCYSYDGSKILTNTVLMKGWAPRIGLDWMPSYEYIATTDLNGNVLGPEKPLKEVDIHLRIYRSREDVGAIIHAHPPYLIAYMMMRNNLVKKPGSFFSILTEAPINNMGIHLTQPPPICCGLINDLKTVGST